MVCNICIAAFAIGRGREKTFSPSIHNFHPPDLTPLYLPPSIFGTTCYMYIYIYVILYIAEGTRST